jgi:hypothetical protein
MSARQSDAQSITRQAQADLLTVQSSLNQFYQTQAQLEQYREGTLQCSRLRRRPLQGRGRIPEAHCRHASPSCHLQDLQGSRQENPPTCHEHRRSDEVICDSTEPPSRVRRHVRSKRCRCSADRSFWRSAAFLWISNCRGPARQTAGLLCEGHLSFSLATLKRR